MVWRGAFNGILFYGMAHGFEEIDSEAVAACGVISGVLNLPLIKIAERIKCIQNEKYRVPGIVTTYVGLFLASSGLMLGATSTAGWDLSYPVTLALSGIGFVSNLVSGGVFLGCRKFVDCVVNSGRDEERVNTNNLV